MGALLNDSLSDAQVGDIVAVNASGQTLGFNNYLDGLTNTTSVNDVFALEFDFDPAGDFVSFNYVFASEEYFAY